MAALALILCIWSHDEKWLSDWLGPKGKNFSSAAHQSLYQVWDMAGFHMEIFIIKPGVLDEDF